MREGLLLGVAVRVGCLLTWTDGEDWDAAGRPCVGEARATVRVGRGCLDGYGYGTVGGDGDVDWAGAGYDTIGNPDDLMRALGHPHPRERDAEMMRRLGGPAPRPGVRALHGAALRSAEARWTRLVDRMTDELIDLLPNEVDVPEPEGDERVEEDEDEYA